MIKYNEPRTWWRYDFLNDMETTIRCIGEVGSYLVDEFDSVVSRNSNCCRMFASREELTEYLAAREAAFDARERDTARQAACLAACDGMATEHLAPGCVAKLVEVAEAVAKATTQNDALDAKRMATAALAAMKGV